MIETREEGSVGNMRNLRLVFTSDGVGVGFIRVITTQ